MPAHQTMQDKIDMYDRCILALRDAEPSDENLMDVIKFLKEERDRLYYELQEIEDGTHSTWAPFREMLESDDPNAVALRYRGAETLRRVEHARRIRNEAAKKFPHGHDFPIQWKTNDDNDD